MLRLDVEEICGGSRVSRADGEKLRVAIERVWDSADVIEVDFGSVPVASVSFFDESFGMLARKIPLSSMKLRMRATGISDADRRLLNSILSSRAKERNEHTWSGSVGGEDWVADVLWDDGTLLGMRVLRAANEADGVENVWWDYAANTFADWQVDSAPPALRSQLADALVRRESAIQAARERLLNTASSARGASVGNARFVTLPLETADEVDAARRLAREGRAMVNGRSCVIRVTPSAAE